MATQLWGTFSVRDHLKRRAFVADVLLYDRLMIPRPPTKEEEWVSPERPSPFEHWNQQGWEPQKLLDLLQILGDLAIQLPWNEQARNDFANLYQENDLKNINAEKAQVIEDTKSHIQIYKEKKPDEVAYFVTPSLLGLYIQGAVQNQVADKILALAKGRMGEEVTIDPVVAYGDYLEFTREQSLQPISEGEVAENAEVYGLFGWDFFVPEDNDLSDQQLLEKAVTLAKKDEFLKMRQYFQYWVNIMHEGKVDPDTAQGEMEKILKEYQAYTKSELGKCIIRSAAKVVKIAAPFATPISKLFFPQSDLFVEAGVSAGAEALAFGVDALVPKKEADISIRPAAVVYDSQRFFRKRRFFGLA